MTESYNYVRSESVPAEFYVKMQCSVKIFIEKYILYYLSTSKPSLAYL